MNVLVFKSKVILWDHCSNTRLNPSPSGSQDGLGTRLHQALNMCIASFPGSPHVRTKLQATESWAGPGNEANMCMPTLEIN